MFGGPFTQLPSEVTSGPAAVPNSGMTDITTVDTEVALITITNTTAGALTITIQDKQTSPQALATSHSISANSELSYDFNPPRLFIGGVSWQASNTGLVGLVRGRKVLGLSQGASSAQTNNLPVPA